MPDGLLPTLTEGVSNTPLLEWLAVATGVVYVLLIMVRHRAGWIFGGISAAIFVLLALRAQLPMNALLQFSYVVAAVYGWWSWSREEGGERPIGIWHWQGHVLVLGCCLLVSLGLARLLTSSAFPFTDSLVTCVGLFATWMVARVYLENWLYWLAVDAVSVYLYFVQGLVVSSLLFVIYLVIASVGFATWLKKYRQQARS